MAAAPLAKLGKMSVKALDELYEDLWAALGPKAYQGAAAKRRATAALLRVADAIRVRTIIDPLDQKGGKGGVEASKRYALYEDGQSVADFILKHGDGPHLRLDVQRGNIRLAATQRPARKRPAKPAKKK
ncbi:MAG TPA: hypothetical protein VFS04_04460 [Alphaproteobacteria bacterium]|nr:hypothetical protein [Alphaproteobacteria bacterium]